ncbi:hypothetical protein V8B55DRAFT_1452174 [Mucor lusitanicus]|uniref:BLOC-1-related complex subunit 7 n=1 Tax=Mucor circinelloides f. lusitanicus TaxID=29924 RepID=A0A8H4EXC3_MUCCL|nr:hypothetical protein FB192DRAFT_1451002 [Mucor lusitanicus]
MQNNRWLPTGASSSRASSIHEDQQQFFASKEECHLKTSKTLDDWEYVIKALSKTSQIHDDTLKTAKLFTQVDSLSKNTRNSIEKTSKTLDRLLDKKLSILAAVKDFNDIQSSLDVGAIARKHWISQEDEEG